jgi:hypothetical protein
MSERPVESPKSSTDEIREYAKRIVENHQDILTIDDDALKGRFLEKLKEYQKGLDYSPGSFEKSSMTLKNELGLNLFIDVINFCYKNPFTKEEYKYVTRDGKERIRTTGLTEAMVESGINWGNIQEVTQLTPSTWAKIIQLDNNKNFYLGAERGARIRNFASLLYRNNIKTASEFLDYCNYDTETMLAFLKNSGFFTDVFQKRAQLTVNMLDQVLQRRTNKRIAHTEILTVMADYRLPQFGYNEGVIKLSPRLKNILMTETPIQKGSLEEDAIRGSVVVMGYHLSSLLGLTEALTDSLLWKGSIDMSKNGLFKIPHMLVATDQY